MYRANFVEIHRPQKIAGVGLSMNVYLWEFQGKIVVASLHIYKFVITYLIITSFECHVIHKSHGHTRGLLKLRSIMVSKEHSSREMCHCYMVSAEASVSAGNLIVI